VYNLLPKAFLFLAVHGPFGMINIGERAGTRCSPPHESHHVTLLWEEEEAEGGWGGGGGTDAPAVEKYQTGIRVHLSPKV